MSALTLRILACLFMFLDHIGYCLGSSHPLYFPLRCIGRLAFPIFVFLIVKLLLLLFFLSLGKEMPVCNCHKYTQHIF